MARDWGALKSFYLAYPVTFMSGHDKTLYFSEKHDKYRAFLGSYVTSGAVSLKEYIDVFDERAILCVYLDTPMTATEKQRLTESSAKFILDQIGIILYTGSDDKMINDMIFSGKQARVSHVKSTYL